MDYNNEFTDNEASGIRKGLVNGLAISLLMWVIILNLLDMVF